MKFFGVSRIGTKGQIVIPVEAREAYNLKEKDKLVVLSAPFDKGIVLVKEDSLDTLMQDFVSDLASAKRLAVDTHEEGAGHH